MDLSTALAVYDRVALNLAKLDHVWQRVEALLPERPFLSAGSEDEIAYTELGESWAKIAESLPLIDGWRPQAEIIDYAAIGQARIDFMDIDEPSGALA